jgi:hypothetical protein
VLNRKRVVLLLKYGLGLGLLAFMIGWYWHDERGGVDVGLAAALEGPIAWPALAAGVVICTLSVALTFVRWYVLVRAQGLPFTLINAVRLGLVGFFFNTCMPGSVGGDIIKAVAIAREQDRRTVAVATVLLDRLIGFCGLIWLVTILGTVLDLTGIYDSAGLTADTRLILRGILATAATLATASLLVWLAMGFCSEPWSSRMANRLERLPKVGVAVAEFWRAVWLYRRRGRSVALALGLSLVSHCGFVFAFYFAALMLTPVEDVPSLAAHFLLVPVGMTVQAGFPTPGGIGLGEYGFGFLYQWVGATFAAGALAALIHRAILWLLGFIGYLVYLRMRASQTPMPSEAPLQ